MKNRVYTNFLHQIYQKFKFIVQQHRIKQGVTQSQYGLPTKVIMSRKSEKFPANIS